MDKERILIVDDDKNICELLRLYLEKEGYETAMAHDGEKALAVFDERPFDLVLLDVMMPRVDGWEACRRIRAKGNTPIIMLTAKGETFDKVLGLELGADDYMTKPFGVNELQARISALLRRIKKDEKSVQPQNEDTIVSGPFTLNMRSRILSKNGEVIELTSVEYKIMELFMKSPGKVFTKQQIYEYGWGEDYIVADNNIMVCISKLRAKLAEDPSAYIKTIRGLGYRLEK